MTREQPTKEFNKIKKADFTRYQKAIMCEKVNYIWNWIFVLDITAKTNKQKF